MKNPTLQELTEYLDGALPPIRSQEIEMVISKSMRLQKEIALLKAMQNSVRNDSAIVPSKKFTIGVMKEILPVQKESLLFRLLKNSSNLFAMVLVLSLIGIVLFWSPSSSSENSSLSRSIESYSTVYNSAMESVSFWIKEQMNPLHKMAATPSGKFIFMGLVVFFIIVVIDEFFSKQNIHSRMKH